MIDTSRLKQTTKIPKKVLIEKALKQRENFLLSNDIIDCDEVKNVDRLLVNYLRHNYTNYDFTEQTYELKKEVNTVIAELFPDLKEECLNQIIERKIKEDFIERYLKKQEVLKQEHKNFIEKSKSINKTLLVGQKATAKINGIIRELTITKINVSKVEVEYYLKNNQRRTKLIHSAKLFNIKQYEKKS